jgi:hypothetical protein
VTIGMHVHIGMLEFVTFLLYYIIAKAFLQFVNIETRRAGLNVPAGVSGLLA